MKFPSNSLWRRQHASKNTEIACLPDASESRSVPRQKTSAKPGKRHMQGFVLKSYAATSPTIISSM
jgi:hypothetical protein